LAARRPEMKGTRRQPARRSTRLIWALSITLLLLVAVGGLLRYWGLIGARVPPARYAAAMVYVQREDVAYLFGGRYEGLTGTAYRNDLWAFDCDRKKWVPVRTSRRPPARGNANVAYDPDRHQIVLFGGIARERLADTWVYDIAANAWHETTPAVGPPPRSDAGMAYDAASGRVILFSGYGLEDSRDAYGDTWAYDPGTNTWTEMHPASSPPVMYGQAMVYDSLHHQVLQWGGHASAYQNGQATSHWYEDDMWRYDYARDSWEKLAHRSPTPPARYWHQAIVDAAGRVLIFGGNGERGFLNDTWIASPEHDTWTRLDTATAPSPRVNAAMAYDATHDVVVLFGGLEPAFNDLQDTWVLEITGTEGHWVRSTP
jgi:N-acetylneuraminic acid mutarotase